MPKVSEEYRDARHRQILDAARRCFARDGFHQTSMQDLFAEAGLSSGAVYRYFPSKAAMIVAIAQENMAGFTALLLEAAISGDDRPLGVLVAEVLETIRDRHGVSGVGAIALTVWAEGVRDRDIADALDTSLVPVRRALTELAEAHQAAGRLPAGVAAESVAALLLTIVPGYIMQLTLFGESGVTGVPDAVRTLYAPSPPTRSSSRVSRSRAAAADRRGAGGRRDA